MPPRRKSRPTFEVPAIAAPPGAPAGWVYREEEPPAAQDRPVHPDHLRRESILRRESMLRRESTLRRESVPGRFAAAGLGLLLVGAAPVAFVSLAALGLAATPFLMAGRALGSR